MSDAVRPYRTSRSHALESWQSFHFQKLFFPPFRKGVGNWPQYLNLIGPNFLIFDLVFVSCDFELGRNVSCEVSTVSPRMGLVCLLVVSCCFSLNCVCVVGWGSCRWWLRWCGQWWHSASRSGYCCIASGTLSLNATESTLLFCIPVQYMLAFVSPKENLYQVCSANSLKGGV